jgi:hypothetical protein
MKEVSLEEDGLALLDLIDGISELEWRKYQGRFQRKVIEGKLETVDCGTTPPFCSFRFITEDDAFVSSLIRLIESYEGIIQWGMFSKDRDELKGRNWIICPKRYWEVIELALNAGKSAGEYLSEREPSVGINAHRDMPSLVKFLKTELTA